VKFAPDGLLWAGTNMGLSFFDPLASQQGRFVDVPLPQNFGPDVLALDFDRRGDAWVGSNNGLALLTAATGEMTHFTSINSGLVSDDIRSLTYDPFTGDMYAATASGISIYKSTTGPPTSVMDSVYAFPNPFVIASQGDRLSFNYALPGTISIFSLEGRLVYEMAAGQSWDGKNSGGAMVASGVYLFVITGDNGDMGRGKFLLVRGR
jgi:ligand-binding sensor domain-containing protein